MARLPTMTAALSLLGLSALWPVPAAAQDGGYFSPTYASSAQGSPYRDVYSRTFGSATAAPEALQTPRAAAPVAASGPAGEVVFVIDSKGLATYRADDYAGGRGDAIARGAVPPMPETATIAGAVPQVPTVADNLYLRPPLETAGGPQPATPVLLIPSPETKAPTSASGEQ
ncbi:hypothetical protein [Pelagibius sp.]|uniref:hypothetical protein n=1 Tax=Pelagibius sp. TaxID=1931238 RepID=UPI003B509E3B